MNKPQVKQGRKLRNIEVVELYHNLQNLKGVSGIKLVYAINRTVAWLRPVVEAFSKENLIPVPDAYRKYQQELRQYYEKLATDENGHVRTKNIVHDDGRSFEVIDVALNDPAVIIGKAEIENRHRDAINEYQKDIDDYNLFLARECEEEIRLYYIPLACAPENKEHFDIVAPLIREMTTDQQARWDQLFAEISSE